MKNIHLVIASCLISIILIYTVLFIYTFFNFDKDFKYTFKSSENLNFHQKYSKKLHHIRDEITLNLLFKKPKVQDLLFTTINNIEDKDVIVLFQGDSWMEQLTHSNARLGAVFEPKSSAAHTDAHDVLELISKINQTPDNDFARIMENTIDMEAFLKTMAVMLFSGAFDQLTGWNPHNYYLYHDPQSQRWHYLPWDLDVGFADNAFRHIPVISGWNAAWPVMGSSPSPLVERIVDNPQLLARYRRLADSILEEYFHPKVLLPRVDSLYNRVKDDLTRDPFPHRRATNPEDQSYENIIDSIKDFIRRRYDTARAQLDDPGTRPKIVKHTPHHDHGPKPGNPSADDPTGLHVTSSSSSVVTLKWTDNSKNEGAYIVQRADGEEGQEFRNHIGQPGADIITASDISVVPGGTYRYRVYALRPAPWGYRRLTPSIYNSK